MLQQSDTLVSVPIQSIRDANRKLIERNKLLEVVAEQDTIIKDYAKLVEFQDKNLDLFVQENDILEELNNNLYKDLARKKKTNNILIGTTSASIIAFVACLLIH